MHHRMSIKPSTKFVIERLCTDLLTFESCIAVNLVRVSLCGNAHDYQCNICCLSSPRRIGLRRVGPIDWPVREHHDVSIISGRCVLGGIVSRMTANI